MPHDIRDNELYISTKLNYNCGWKTPFANPIPNLVTVMYVYPTAV